MKDKPIELLQDEVVKTAHKFAVTNKIKIIGSQAKRGILFPSDFDFVSEFKQRPKALAHELKKLFSNKRFMNTIYFMDFKCGLNPNFAPDYPELEREKWILRWSINDIKNGHIKLIGGGTKSLEDALEDDTTIKIDWILRDPIMECSMNIQYKQTLHTKEEEIESLKQDVQDYLKTNTMKSMKRLYSLLVVTNENKTLQTQLVDYFNSDVGIVNKAKNDLETIRLLLDKYPDVKVENEIQQVKQNLGCIDWLDEKRLKKMNVKTLHKTIDYLQNTLNTISKDVLANLTESF
jgi:hypothetical protein